MKTIKNISAIAIFIAATLLTASCKKDKAEDPNQTTAQKIIAKWKFESAVMNDHYGGADHPTTYAGSPGDYFDFRADGKIYAYIFGTYDTTNYAIVDDTHVWVDVSTEVYEIKTLNGSAMQFYRKTVTGADFYEETENFSK